MYQKTFDVGDIGPQAKTVIGVGMVHELKNGSKVDAKECGYYAYENVSYIISGKGHEHINGEQNKVKSINR